ncbi:MAG: hypothetical protein ACK496_19355 [Acidobacteriota bacterium]
MDTFFYRYDSTARRRLLADAGFVRQKDRPWRHADGRSIGEGVAFALADEPFFRYLGLEAPEPETLSAALSPQVDTEGAPV